MEIFTDAMQYLGLGYDALTLILIPAAFICVIGALYLDSD